MTQNVRKRIWTTWEHFPSVGLGVLCLAICALMLISKHDLDSTSLAKAFPVWATYGWLGLLGLGGGFCLIGVLTRRPRLEGAGLCLVGSAYIIDFWAIVDDRAVAGFLSGGLILAAGIAIWFQAFIQLPKRDYPSNDSVQSNEVVER